MTAIDRAALETTNDVASTWRQVASHVLAWAGSNEVSPRDTIVLLPFAALLPHARAAFATGSAWMPRIETPLTLAGALGPPVTAGAGQLSLDPTADRLTVAQLLRAQPWGQAWSRSDPRAFEQAVAAVVDTAHALARAAALHPPDRRAERWTEWRELLAPFSGPGARQRALAQLALEWASQAPAPATDRLHALRPAAWVVVQAGGADPFSASLLEHSAAPRLCLDLDPRAAARFDPPGPPPAFALCDDFEHEAQCSAAQVLAHVCRGEVPVALISQDRVLVRRVRALLERQHIALYDETGWKLSTTRAAAQLMSLLKAARPNGTTDSVLDWLKSGTRWSAPDDGALAQFEADCRRHQRVRVTDLLPEALAEPARSLWADVSAALAAFYSAGRLPLAAWLQRTVQALQAAGSWPALQADDAGRQVLSQLHLESADATPSAWAQRLDATMTLHEFVGWVDSVLEQASFLPAGDRSRPADVIITPLARAMLRPFAAVVCPGADARRLGAAAAPHALLPEATLAELGLPDAAQRHADEALAFAQLLRLPNLTLLRRRRDGDEPLADSPLVERLRLALARRGEALRDWEDPRIDSVTAATPIAPSAGVAPALLPRELSASACEALRACPYRFFALNVLRAREADELDEEVEKRDYGTWLHAVLHAFHTSRRDETSAAEDIASLHRLADEKRAEHGLAAADFVPFGASFEAFVPRYVAWQRARDAAGARWQQGEQRERMNLPQAEAFVLEGIIDRVDQVGAARSPQLQLIDYKTGSASGLKEKVRDPLEDTQLAFYAALMRAQRSEPLRASYLALDGRQIEEIEHKGVEASAALLLDGLAADLRRLQAGEGMAPLGEASACDFCAARGVCRRDHWTTPPDTVEVDGSAAE
jgi:ATP-dependent helicase/nuclease subunit B